MSWLLTPQTLIPLLKSTSEIEQQNCLFAKPRTSSRRDVTRRHVLRQVTCDIFNVATFKLNSCRAPPLNLGNFASKASLLPSVRSWCFRVWIVSNIVRNVSILISILFIKRLIVKLTLKFIIIVICKNKLYEINNRFKYVNENLENQVCIQRGVRITSQHQKLTEKKI